MTKVFPVRLSRGLLYNLPTVYQSVGDSVSYTGFGRYVRRLEAYLNVNGFDVASCVAASVREMKPETLGEAFDRKEKDEGQHEAT